MSLSHLFDLSGIAAIVTGASQGLGRRLAVAVAAAGASVTVAARRESLLHDLVDEIEAAGGAASAVAIDLCAEGAPDELLAAALGRWGRIDLLVNNAGISPVVQEPQAYSTGDWARIFDLNVRASFLCAQAVGRWMIENGVAGSIVNVGSVAGMHSLRGVSVYAASKAAVLQLTQSLAYEWAPYGIRVNALCPGIFESATTADLRARGGQYYRHLLDRIPLGRFGTLEELDAAVVFLASPGASYVTGALLPVDGGWSTL